MHQKISFYLLTSIFISSYYQFQSTVGLPANTAHLIETIVSQNQQNEGSDILERLEWSIVSKLSTHDTNVGIRYSKYN